MAYFDRAHQPVIMDVGPVLSIEDVLGGKVCALAGRFEVRDFVDAAALERHRPDELIGFARRLDPGLTETDFTDAVERLDLLPDSRFARYGLSSDDVARLREQFAAWPR